MNKSSQVEIQGKLGWVAGGVGVFLILLAIPFPELQFPGRVVLATAILMALWWMSEAIPISATALLPLVIFPLFGVISSTDAAAPYADHNVFLFLGGFFIAKAMEHHDLHRRVALFVLSAVGVVERRIVLGFIVGSAFLSMWISNTATAMMMLPIGLSVVRELKSKDKSFAKAAFLGIAYGASIGGMGTLVGTPPNLMLAGQFKNLFPQAPEITFLNWIPIGLPVIIMMIPAAWWVLCFLVFKVKNSESADIGFIRKDAARLGKMSYEEKVVAVVFSSVALGWIFRKEINLAVVSLPGWRTLLGVSQSTSDATVAVLGAIVLFAFPSKKGGRILEWRTAKEVPWGIVLLFGGGFALAEAFGQSGLSEWIGNLLGGIGDLPAPLLVILVVLGMMILTEFTSNTATASLMLPILASMGIGLNTDPRILMIPAALAASSAFMLPVATPPNAIVFGSGELRIKDMMKAGIALNLISVIVILVAVMAIAVPWLRISHGVLPSWAD
jgi:sodium-dependent dicarboxylate transporter 2/3/5